MGDKRLTKGSLALNDNKVIVINPVKAPVPAKLRVAAYARVSSDSTDQLNSFVAQTNYYLSLISSNENWKLVDIYADEGITGTSASKRGEFQRLLSDCRKGLVDRILVKSISRFARNTKECLEIARELKAIGVTIYFEEQRIDTSKMDGEFMTALHATIAQAESESISKNQRWSYKHRMQSGTFLPSSVPFGYVLAGREIEVDEYRAGIVRRIYADYLSGMSMDDITKWLNRESSPGRSGDSPHNWTRMAVSYILSNERYIGDSLWQKTYATDTLPTQQVKNRGEREMYYATGTHTAIIEKEVFGAVQQLKNHRSAVEKNYSSRKMFSKTIFCGECGTLFHQRMCGGKPYWVCRNHYSGKDNCSITQIAEDEIQAAFLRLHHKLKTHGISVLERMLSDLQAVREKQMLWSMDVIELNKEISDLSNQNRMLADMKKLGLVDSDIFIAKTNDIARQLTDAKQKKAKIIEDTHDDMIPRTQELLDALDDMPEFLPEFDTEAFDALVDKIIVADNGCLLFRLKNSLELKELIRKEVQPW